MTRRQLSLLLIAAAVPWALALQLAMSPMQLVSAAAADAAPAAAPAPAAAAAAAAAAANAGLLDHPIAAASHTSLDGTWTASTTIRAPGPAGAGRGISIQGTVPGDLITDLQAAGMVGDPLFELNFLNSSLWADQTWTYTTTFNTPQATAARVRKRRGAGARRWQPA